MTLEPEVTLRNVSAVDAVHEQFELVVTVTEPAPPAATALAVVADSVYPHAAAACVRVKVCPATVRVAVRCDVVAFEATEYPTDPFPFPLAPDVIDVNVDPEVTLAVQVQPLPAMTATEPVPPPEPIGADVGLIEYVQDGGGGVDADG